MSFRSDSAACIDLSSVFRGDFLPEETMNAHEKASSILAISGNASFTNQIFVSIKKSDDCAGIRKSIQSKDGDHTFPKITLSLATLGFFGDLELPVRETLEVPFKCLPINLQKLAEDASNSGIEDVGFEDGRDTIIKYVLEHEASLEKPNDSLKLISQFLDNYNNYNTQASSLSDTDKSRQILRHNLLPSDLRDLFVQEFVRSMTDPLVLSDKLPAIYPKEVQSLVIARSKFLRSGGLLDVWNKAIQKAEDAKASGRPILRVFQSTDTVKSGNSSSNNITHNTNNRTSNSATNSGQTCPLWARNPLQRGLCDGSCGLAHSFRDSTHYGRMTRATGITHSENVKKQVLANHLRVKTKVKNMKSVIKPANAMKRSGKGSSANNNRISSAAANVQNPLQQHPFGLTQGGYNPAAASWGLASWGHNPQLQQQGYSQQHNPYSSFSGGGSSSSSKGNGNAKAAGNQISNR